MCPRDGLCPSDAFATPDNHNTSVKTITYTTELCHASIEKYDILDSRGIVVLGSYNDVYRKTKPPSARRNSMPGWPVVQASCHPQSEPVCRAVVPQRETAAPARLADQSTATSPPGCRRSGDIDRLARADGLLMDVAHGPFDHSDGQSRPYALLARALSTPMVPTDIRLHDLVIAGHRTASLTIHLERCGRRVARPRQRLRNGQRPSRRARRRRPPDRHLSRQPPVKASPQGDVSGGGSGCGPPVVTGIQVPPPPGGADQSPGYHSSHMGPGDSHLCRGTTATSPEHPAASPAPVPQPVPRSPRSRTVADPRVGGDRRKLLLKPIPGGRREKVGGRPP